MEEKAAKKHTKNLIAGVGYGTKRFFCAIGKGIGGIVSEPIKGAKENGIMGATKGVGKGLIGLVSKPVGGAVELVQHTVEGTINTPAAIKKLVKGNRNM